MIKATELRNLESLAVKLIREHEFLGYIIPVKINSKSLSLVPFKMDINMGCEVDCNRITLHTQEIKNSGERFFLVKEQRVEIFINAVYGVAKTHNKVPEIYLAEIIDFIASHIRSMMFPLDNVSLLAQEA